MKAANDNWSPDDLKLTVSQVRLLEGWSSSVYQKIQENTEDSLFRRKMLSWRRLEDGAYSLKPTPKGIAAIEQYYGRTRKRG